MDAAKLVRAVVCPHIIVRALIQKLSLGSLEFRLAMQALDQPAYAFGIRQAIWLASKLGHSRVSVIEFGVGTGRGLRAMEAYAAALGRKYGFSVEIYGFDLGSGLPRPSDYRDLPYLWKNGDYRMDVPAVQSALGSAKLILGDVKEAIPKFLGSRPAPIGFISFDLDYYSSTVSAFSLFEGADECFLPRVVCYFDDILSDGCALHCEYAGELLAISEFNAQSGTSQKISATTVREPIVRFPAAWLAQIYVYHRFSHPLYNTYVR